MHTPEYHKLEQVDERMWYFRSLHGHIHRLAKQGLATTTDARVLDAGCGAGGLISVLKRREPTWQFSGIDVSEIACRAAAQRCPFADIRVASITAPPFADQSLDAIFSTDVVNHVDEPKRALSEFNRCLKSGGVTVINVAAYMWLWSYHDEACHTKHRYVRGELVSLLEGAGFEAFASTHWNTLPFPLLVAKRKLFPSRTVDSDVRLFPAPVEAVFNGMMALEHAWLRRFARLPFGSSVLVGARKVREV